MTDLTWAVPLPVVIPLAAAGLALVLWRNARAQGVISVVALSLVLVTSVALLVAADDGPLVLDIGSWAAPVGIDLVADRLSTLMLTVSSAVTLCVLLYSLAQGLADNNAETPVAIFHPTYLVLTAGVANAFLTGDLFNLFVGFEMLLVASYVLITLGGTGERIRAGTIYIVVSLLSSMLFLLAVALVYAATGTVNMAQLAVRLQQIDPDVAFALQLLLLLAFGIKAAVFPLFAWLPDSYPTAPAPVTAVFAGLLTKVGVYAIIRTQTLLFPDGRADDLLMWVALATMLVGILGAVAQNDVKRMISFTLVSHIGYMVFGIALSTEAGLSAAIFYVAHHITVQTTLFLVVGLMERRGGSTSLDALGGLARIAPLLAVMFFLPAMNLAGIPPLSGFLGKAGLIQAGAEVGTPLAYTLVAGGIVTSLLTLYAIVKAWNKAFWQPAPEEPREVALPRGMVGSAAALVVAGVALTVVAGPLYDYTERAAATLRDREQYVTAVLPGGRGEGRSADVTDEARREGGTDRVEEGSDLEDVGPRGGEQPAPPEEETGSDEGTDEGGTP
ncbi:monovalent cation/H+ antiporter subunit D [Actinotalea ferrariae CF5-4]|uniref:Monovalent cation/H+ antiporter subunit D n=1 Tax=Actinotalea ferrariae CF5-4 TaxID=948458 RepID=A0A021VQZ7_9CELL|nr:Na+/H+ antiporter subunit D [Actinotalea ferrariae]EYR63624.1 monovalent cation/H+ antiporter subunit D [Actinotalea ferrariae CF5-4]